MQKILFLQKYHVGFMENFLEKGVKVQELPEGFLIAILTISPLSSVGTGHFAFHPWFI